MTEDVWRGCTDPTPMLRFLIGTSYPRVRAVESFPDCRASDRKLRLFACACYHRIRHLLPDARARDAVEVAEHVADGAVPAEELQRAEAAVQEPLDALEGPWRVSRWAERMALLPTHEALALARVVLWRQAQKAAYYASSKAYLTLAAIATPTAASYASQFCVQLAEKQAQADLLRCIFGNPFRPVPIDPAWLAYNDSTVVKLAHSIYDKQAFDRMPILADALQEAGCQNADILGHCRQLGVHARGCWVIDSLTGRS